ncbi:MAG: TetR/AcrR family transcriptional regulator [Steroidobacteraceae bacterium]|nr:TetR/AcrR family transcriptional regulator [Steroidobacteraceae bacterium]MDW8258745.1 TetR/AcrR family transcriptional regulator [Gammaproteobacteria bacterium]
MNELAERRQEEKDRRRSDILDAAETVARRTGLDGITMDQVARQARLSRPLIYCYFRDREELLFGLCQRALQRLHRAFLAATEGPTCGLAKTRACGEAYVRLWRDEPLLFAAMSRFEAHTPDIDNLAPNERACVELGDAVQRVLVDAIELGLRDGSIRHDVGSPNLVAVTLWGYLHGVLQLAATKANVLKHLGITLEGIVGQAFDLATRALAAGPAAGTER